MPVINIEVQEEINKLLGQEFRSYLSCNNYKELENSIIYMIESLHKGIDDKKRSNYGIVYVVNHLCKQLYTWSLSNKQDPFDLGVMFINDLVDYRAICVGFGIISHVGIKEPNKVWQTMLRGADHSQWEVKEFIQMFVRKITKVNREFVQGELITLTQSVNPNLRRFASEALRPVVENKWIQDKPEFSIKVLRHLFKESHEFPRVSVANNLSDLARKNPELIFEIVKELKALNNKDSDFIAHRACRNLVKTETNRVLVLLGINEYVYKNNRYKYIED